jgi:seryl-tRNA synthetase
VGRTLAALVENCFDGKKILIPNALHKYLDFKTIEL